MSKTEECLFVLDLLDAEKINTNEAEKLIFAMQPEQHGRGAVRETRLPDSISVTVDGRQEDLAEVMHKLSAAFELSAREVIK